jgi:hypothetical protein
MLKAASNHWVLPTAASFGWTDIAAAADPLRSVARQKGCYTELRQHGGYVDDGRG